VKWEGKCKRRDRGGKREGMEERKMGMQKIAKKCNILAFGTPLGGYRSVSHILESSFYEQKTPRRQCAFILNYLEVI